MISALYIADAATCGMQEPEAGFDNFLRAYLRDVYTPRPLRDAAVKKNTESAEMIEPRCEM